MSVMRMKTNDSVASALCKTALFKGYSHRDVAAVLRFSDQRCIGPREIVFYQGQFCSAFFVVVLGVMKLTRRTHNGREQVIGFAFPGNIVGETGLFSPDGYTVTGVTLEYTELLAIRSAPFLRFLQENPDLSQRMLAELSTRINSCIDQIEQLSTHNADQKVAAFLLRHCNEGQSSRSTTDTGHRYRLSDLASLLSIRPETLCRTISRFKERDWVVTTKGKIAVKDAPSLSGLLA